MSGFHYYKSDSDIYWNDDFSLQKATVDNDNMIKSVKIIPAKLPGFDPLNHDYPGFIDKDYIYWFNFAKRDKLIVTDKAIANIVKTIPFNGVRWALTKEEQDDAVGNPTFFVDIARNDYFVSIYKSNAIQVYKGCLGLKPRS